MFAVYSIGLEVASAGFGGVVLGGGSRLKDKHAR